MLATEEDFELPLGYLEPDGSLHRSGVMRLATAADEILPMRDPRVRNLPAYLIVILLSRVVLRIGTVREVTPAVIEGLFSQDLAFLQDLYNRMNGLVPPPLRTSCDRCGAEVEVEVPLPGGIAGYPVERVYEEVAMLGQRVHWTHRELLELDHRERGRWLRTLLDLEQRT